jgi:tetratricopeptide (TPR) repeat protein
MTYNKCKYFIIILLYVTIIASCNSKHAYPVNMVMAEKVIINNPNKALVLLEKLHSQIPKLPKETQMYYEILLFRAKDMCYVPHSIKDKNTIEKCIAYYKINNDNDKLMVAYYCLGCYYRSKNDYVNGIKTSHEALNLAPNSKAYSLIGRIYTLQSYFLKTPQERIVADKAATMYYKLGKDSVTLACTLRDIALEYQVLTKNDSALIYGKQALKIINTTNDVAQKGAIGNDLVSVYLGAKQYNDAKMLLDNVRFVEMKNNISLYDIDLGWFYKGVNKNDSAIYYLKQCIKTTDDDYLKYNSYVFLQQIYQQEGSLKESLRCEDMAISIHDTIDTVQHDKEVVKINAKYNLSGQKKIIADLKADKSRLYWALTIVVFLIAVGLIYWYITRKRNKATEPLNDIHIQKKSSSEIIAILHNYAKDGHDNVSSEQWAELTDLLNREHNNFTVRLNEVFPSISDNELHICCLIKTGFVPVDIAILTCHTKQGVSMARKRLYKKLSGKDGSASDLDVWLESF